MRSLAFVLATFLWAGTAQAASIAITNPGFEDPVLVDGDFEWSLYPFSGTSVGGWTTAGGVGSAAGIINPTTDFFSAGAPEGNNVGFLISYNSAWLIQTLTATYQEGETYTLTALVGDADNRDLKGFNIGLYSGGLVSTGGSLPVPADDGFALVMATVVADASMAGQPIEIRLYSSSLTLDDDPDSADRGVFFDDVRLTTTAPVPVPAAVWLFGSALAGLGWLRRKQGAASRSPSRG